MNRSSFKQTLAGGLLLLCVFAMPGLSGTANACVICIPYPTKTAADYLVESETVVLAREDLDKAWSYTPIETLKGETNVPPIDNFLNSATRRMLAAHPQRGVVFTLDPGDRTKWRGLGFADEEYERMIREIIRRSPDWGHTGSSSASRLAFFADYLGHHNRDLHELAYLEIGRARYSQIKQLGARWPLDQVRALLRNPVYYEWHPLAILILAHNGDANDRNFIAGKFSSLARFGQSTNLSAWTTALIEIQQGAAVAEVEEKYFRSSRRTREELVAVTAALSEHGTNGHTHLRDQIVQSYSTLLEHHPEMASHVAKDLTAWKRWELTDQLAKTLDAIKQTDPLTAYAIRMYLAQAKKGDTRW
jgi:hypothetical protein